MLVHIAIFGAAREADEGATAHHLATAYGRTDAGAGVLRDQVAATGSKRDVVCTCTASWSCSRIDRTRLFSQFVKWDS